MDKKKIQMIALAAIFAVMGVVLVYQMKNLRATGRAKEGKEEEKPQTLTQRLLDAEVMSRRLPIYRNRLAGKEKEIEALRRQVPLASDHTWLSRQINEVAEEIGIGPVSQKFRQGLSTVLEDTGAGDKYAVRSWELNMKCGYHELGRFLNKLEESNMFVEVLDINIKGNDPRGQEISLLMRYLVRRQQ